MHDTTNYIGHIVGWELSGSMSKKYYFEVFEFESSTYNHKQNNENLTKLTDLICSFAYIVTLYRAKGYEQCEKIV